MKDHFLKLLFSCKSSHFWVLGSKALCENIFAGNSLYKP